MAEVEQVPGSLDLVVGEGDDLALALDFDVDLTGYTFEAVIEVTGQPGSPVPVPVTGTSLASGQIGLGLTDVLLASVPVGIIHAWYLKWTFGAISRRVLAGAFKIVSMP